MGSEHLKPKSPTARTEDLPLYSGVLKNYQYYSLPKERSSIMSGLSCAFQTSNSPELGPGKWNADEDRSYLLQMDISSM